MTNTPGDGHEFMGTERPPNPDESGLVDRPEDSIQHHEVAPLHHGSTVGSISKVLILFAIAAIAGTWWYLSAHGSETEARAKISQLGAFITPGAADKPAHTIHLSMVQDKTDLDTIVGQLPKFRKLKNLDARGAPLDDDHLKMIGRLDSLIGLTVTETNVTDQGMAYLTGLHRLQNLTLYGTQVGNRGLAEIGKLKSVLILNIGNTQVAGNLAEIAGMENLEWLVANGLTLADDVATTLTALDNLSHLTIEGAQISDQAVQAIREGKPGIGLDR